jgi:NAD(P)-dependent dehydrogenase (short-subunit alcohol dehydrogenase family)
MGAHFSQFFPPTPTLTEKNLPDQRGKVFIVTGGSSGVGFELARILFGAGGKVYIAGRSEENARSAIDKITSSVKDSPVVGQLEFLYLELSDLSSIKASAEDFKSRETKLDVLWNNAGVSMPPAGSVSKQGHELMMATNCLGPFLFTLLLLPILKATAQNLPPGSVRTIWTSSQTVDLQAPKEGFDIAKLNTPSTDSVYNYVASKLGNWFIASELASKVKSDGILNIVQNPGNLNTNLLRNAWWMKMAAYPLLYPAKMGAYTELWAGLSDELKMENNGGYVVPWGRLHPATRQDLLDCLKSEGEGGNGKATKFWQWCEEKTTDYS